MTDNKPLVSLLASNSLFRSLPKTALEALLNDPRCFSAAYAAKEAVYTGKSFQKTLAVLLSGTVCVYRSGNGKRVLLNRLEAGGIFGATSLFGEEESFATVITAQTKAEILFLPAEVCEELIMVHPDFAISYIRFLSDRIRFLNRRIAQLAGSDVEQKLAKYLYECGERITPNMKQLASALGIGRASLYRAIDELSEKGLLCRDGKDILILDRKGLQEFI